MSGRRLRTFSAAALCAVLPPGSLRAETTGPSGGLIGPLPYFAFDNPAAGDAVSPFAQLPFQYFFLEDLEDGAFNVPGVTIEEVGPGRPLVIGSRITLGSERAVDSVDGDDGVVDGQGGFMSLWSNRFFRSFTFVFSGDELGQLPTHAGVVWTDVGRNGGGLPMPRDLVDNVTFQAYDADGLSLGTIGPLSVGDGTIFGTTEEDRFFGIVHPKGISRMRISMPRNKNWEIDHLQYGLLVPEPAAWALAALGCLALAADRLIMRSGGDQKLG